MQVDQESKKRRSSMHAVIFEFQLEDGSRFELSEDLQARLCTKSMHCMQAVGLASGSVSTPKDFTCSYWTLLCS